MNIYKLILATVCLSFYLNADQLYSSDKESSEEGWVVIPKGKEKPGSAETTYAQEAKALANRIKEGFIETSKVPGLTSCIASGTKLYAGFGSSEDQEKAESITEFYLNMGEKEGLNLSDMNAVYVFLTKKFDARISQNIQKGGGFLASAKVLLGAKCLTMAGDRYYKYRLAQAMQWAYNKTIKDLGEGDLKPEAAEDK